MKLNYRNFKKEFTITDNITIKLPSISTKNEPIISVIDKETGNVTETQGVELKDENINFAYDGSNISDYHRRAEPLNADITTPETVSGITYGKIDYGDDECGEATKDGVSLKILQNSDKRVYQSGQKLTKSEFSEYSVPIKPIHKYLTGDLKLNLNGGTQFEQPGKRDIILPIGRDNIRDIMSCGLYPGLGFDVDNVKSYLNKNINSTTFKPLSKKAFDSAVNIIKKNLVTDKFTVAVTRFIEKYDTDNNDINYSGIERKRLDSKGRITENAMTSALTMFKATHSALDPIESDSISPYSTSVKEVSRAFMDASPGELIDELITLVSAIGDIINMQYDIDPSKGIDVDDLFDKLNDNYNEVLVTSDPADAVDGTRFAISKYNSLQSRIVGVIDKIGWYETFVGVPVNLSYQRYGITGIAEPMTSFLRPEKLYDGPRSKDKYYQHLRLGRFLIPVDYGYKKVRKEGLLFPSYEYIDQGIRWVLVEFNNASVFDKFRTNNTKSGNTSGEVDDDGCEIKKEIPNVDITEEVDVLINFKMPHLPFDYELRKIVFDKYGYFDQSKLSIREPMNLDPNPVFDPDSTSPYNDSVVDSSEILEGYQVFLDDDSSVGSLRNDYDVHDKVQFLVNILKTEFGSNRVKLIECARSSETQNKRQLGGDVSNMLSWHNYGLGARILITGEDGIKMIEDGSDDFYKLYEIAKTFTQACYNGSIGASCNVVWCSLLKTGPDMFEWEFLPPGVGHKDAYKFRESVFNQKDALIHNAYVKADDYVTDKKPTSESPYILTQSKAYKQATIINGEKYVHISKVKYLNPPSNLVLKDIQEFIYLILSKKKANGDSLSGTTINSWKQGNPISFKQLITYNSIIGNYEFIRSLLAIDYIEQFNGYMQSGTVVESSEFLLNVLGEYSYSRIQIKVKSENDGKYISLVDGKLHIPKNSVESTQPEGNGNTFGQKQIDINSYKFIDSGEIVSDEIVLDEKTLTYINDLIKDKVLTELTYIRELYEAITSNVMYDTFKNGNNKDDIDLIENEFGVISTQDVLTFDTLAEAYREKVVTVDYNGNPRDGGGVVFEKLISNAEKNGVQIAQIGREKPVVDDIQLVSKSTVINNIFGNNAVNVNDII